MNLRRGNALVHCIKVVSGLEIPHSQTTDRERELIRKYCRRGTAVEIGVYEGVNTVNIAESLAPGGVVYAIDPFYKGILGLSYSKAITKRGLRKRRVLSRVRFLEMLSWEAAPLITDAVDFVFIDGDHSYEGIKRDWKDWSEKMKIGGIIALHDTSEPAHDPTVKELGSYRFFNETIKFDERFEVVETVDSLNLLKRIRP